MAFEQESSPRSASWRSALWLGVFACVFLFVGWSAYWYVARRMAENEFHTQLEREAQVGRIWTCASLTFRGYPLSISIDCSDPRLRIENGAGAAIISARRALIAARLYTPTLVDIDVTAPAEVDTDDARTSLDWTSLQIETRGLPKRLDRLSIVGRGVTVEFANSAASRADAIHLNLRRTTPSQMAPYALALGLAGIDSPALTKLIGAGGPALFTALGSVTQLDAATAGLWTERLQSWSAAGGRATIAALSLTRDAFAVEAEGSVGLDQQHRPDGKFAVKVRNAGPALLALAEASGKVQRNSIAGQLALGVLGRPGELKFDVTADGGALSIGPLRRLLTLPALY